jgi:hypothetical protein
MAIIHVPSSLGTFIRIPIRTSPFTTSRQISTNSAIERGIRKSSAAFDLRRLGPRDREDRRSAFDPQDRTHAKERGPFLGQDRILIDGRWTSRRGEHIRAEEDLWQDDTIEQRNGEDRYNGRSKRDTRSERSPSPFSSDDSSAGRSQSDWGLMKRRAQSRYVRDGGEKGAFENNLKEEHTTVNLVARGRSGQRYKTRGQENRFRESPKIPFEDRQYGISGQTQGQIATLPGNGGGISRRLTLNGSKRNNEAASDEAGYENRDSETSSPSRRFTRAFAAPLSIPYTTAASEFLYGYSVVLAALRARRRKLYNLYLHSRAARHEGICMLKERAKTAGVHIHDVNDEWLPIMDKLSNGRPHNVRYIYQNNLLCLSQLRHRITIYRMLAASGYA